jgi:hypothetical protein
MTLIPLQLAWLAPLRRSNKVEPKRIDWRPARAAGSPRLGTFAARRDRFFNLVANSVTVLAGAIAILVVAAVTVVFSIG